MRDFTTILQERTARSDEYNKLAREYELVLANDINNPKIIESPLGKTNSLRIKEVVKKQINLRNKNKREQEAKRHKND